MVVRSASLYRAFSYDPLSKALYRMHVSTSGLSRSTVMHGCSYRRVCRHWLRRCCGRNPQRGCLYSPLRLSSATSGVRSFLCAGQYVIGLHFLRLHGRSF